MGGFASLGKEVIGQGQRIELARHGERVGGDQV